MASRGIPTTNSMFACLKLEDEIREEKRAKRNNKNNQQNENSNPKQQDAKKKNKAASAELKQLQQMAFGKPGSGGKKKSGKNSNNSKEDKNWDQWKQHDKEAVEGQFKDDLEKALLESRLEKEQADFEVKEKKHRVEAGTEVPATREERKKKKQKDKAKAMSLQEFKEMPAAVRKTSNSDDSDGHTSPPPINYRVPTSEQDSKFFNNVQNDAKQILRQDKMQEDYRKTYAADNAVVAKLKYDLELKDTKIEELSKQMEKMQAEMKQVKHRNKQLCVILAQGEMKDKAQVLLQVDQLNTVKDELMEQVTSLTADLEKEKSKNRALKTESDKLKGSKHGK